MVDVLKQVEKFKEFIKSSCEKELHEAIKKGERSLVIDFLDLLSFDVDLAEEVLNEPIETIKAAESALDQFDPPQSLRARFFNIPESQNVMIKDIRSSTLGTFVAIEGIVRQASDVRPQVTSAKFECPACGNNITILQLDSRFKEPMRCSCGRRGKFRFLSKALVDAQRLVIEEVPESLEGGEQPKRLSVFLKEDLVEPKMEKKTTPGSKVIVTGVMTEIPILLKSGAQSTRYDIALDSNYIMPAEETFADIDISKKDEDEIKNLSKDPAIYEKLIASISPSIYGHDDVKEALLLQLVGGTKKTRKDATVSRGDIHILLVGDPGSGKSMMLSYISKIAPKGRLVSGKGATAAGITATVVKDEFLRGWALEAGAMVLANGGIAIIDELDKMSPEDRSALHEAMEQQRITITKANIQACYSEDTEVLTEAGWKNYNKVESLKIAQYNTQNRRVTFLPHNGLYIYNYKGKMFHFKNKRNDILVTPNHTMLLKSEKSNKFEPIRAEDIKTYIMKFTNSGEFEGGRTKTFILPAIKHKQNRKHKKYTKQEKPNKIPFNLWLEFLGYYVTEGGLQKRASFGIPQKNGRKAQKIKECLSKLAKYIGFTLSETKEGPYTRYQITNTQLFDYISENCGKKHLNKRLPLDLTFLSRKQLRILFDAMMLGDGASDGKSFSSTSKELIDQFQSIAFLIGKSASLHVQYKDRYRGNRIKMYRVCISDRTQPSMKKNQIKKIKYNGEVFCFATKTGFFVTRRNGKIAIQGNTLKAETTVLAAANPKLGRFDPYTPIAAQIDLPPTLINRFDLIFPIRDIPNRELDDKIAGHILALHQKPMVLKTEIPSAMLKKYIAYAKQRVSPKLTHQAIEEIKSFYVGLRSLGSSSGEEIKPIPISARQLEALVRLAEASAKISLSNKVRRKDAQRAINILKKCLMQVGFDYETGRIDIDRISTGITAAQRSKIVVIREIINALESKGAKAISISEIISEAESKGIEGSKVEEIIEKLKRSGDLYEPKLGFLSKL